MCSLNDNEELQVPTVREVQQTFAELLSHGEDITWDLLSADQGDILKSKIKELKTMQGFPGGIPFFMNQEFFKSIWNMRKYTNGQSLTSLFFVLIVDDVTDPKLAEQSRSWYLYPVFRCRRCVDNHDEHYSSLDCCMVYVNQYFCYEDWDKFVENASFRPGLMVTPYCGVYKLIDGQVELRTYSIFGRNLQIFSLINEHCITPETLSKSSYQSILRLVSDTNMGRFDGFTLEREEPKRDKILPKQLIPRQNHKSLILFTHSINNIRLAMSMIEEPNFRNVLGNQLKIVFDKISEETKSFRGNVDLVRSANIVPTKKELNEILKPSLKGFKKRKLTEDQSDVSVIPIESLKINEIQIKDEKVNLDDYGTALKEHIVSMDTFEDLITIMAENLEPEMFKLILHFTQTSMETTRKELWLERRHYLSTETVLYQIILYIMKQHSNLDHNEIKEQSSEILRRMRYYFASTTPNSPPELLTKCTKCIGFYRKVPI
ncbi:uncharacterized protein LOC123036941 [Drosophila rhopaloa]|uniref:DUF4781 domain-containing protein n=1 Tax=Drosophila rhopaloa TaxID=1041015 RepID=A0ABM5J4M6_DRORH|nr:uncharacterized protein LOC123036941 [Drosophila rhopaloa]